MTTAPDPGPTGSSSDPGPRVEPRAGGRRRLAAGVLGRAWLWFVAGCLVITFLPMVFGWRPFVVESGSMMPRIDVGDIVLAAPDSNPSDLLGRVTVFTDPDFPDRTKVHRIVAINPGGTLESKGDANPTVDPVPVPIANVDGLGRLLVGFAGLPLVWLQTGQWLLLALFLASLLVSGYAVSRDADEDEEDRDGPDDDPSDGMPPGQLLPLPERRSSSGTLPVAASRPLPPGLARADHRRATRRGAGAPTSVRRWARRGAYAGALSLALAVPGGSAAFSATAASTQNSWTVPNWDYSTSVTALAPWMYWKLDETGTGTVAADTSGNGRTGVYTPGGTSTYFTKGVTGSLTSDPTNLAVTLTNASSCITMASTTAVTAPTSLTEIVWFKAPVGYSAGGKLFGFETPRTGVALAGSGGTYDRHLYMDGAGKVWWGVYNAGDHLVSSPTVLNDGAWHMAVGTLSPTTGMALYIDGTLVGTNTTNVAETTTGWFRAGCGNLAGWGDGWTGGNSPTTTSSPARNYPFLGSLDEISVWNSVLTAAQLRSLYISH